VRQSFFGPGGEACVRAVRRDNNQHVSKSDPTAEPPDLCKRWRHILRMGERIAMASILGINTRLKSICHSVTQYTDKSTCQIIRNARRESTRPPSGARAAFASTGAVRVTSQRVRHDSVYSRCQTVVSDSDCLDGTSEPLRE
jgi:hypothetical protein